VALAVTFWFARRVEDLNPPDDDLEMVAHLDLLERYEALEVFEALRDEAVFEVVAAGIPHETPVETPALTPPVPAAASAPPVRERADVRRPADRNASGTAGTVATPP
jgi:hypothetical protein